ncbi:2-oxo acid dehydrogenase subunit E2 [Croceicoccus sediminis]|uniref:2-oxo acid dehydrogenase subunit E2 n=1 Tax=Croceicoccus sediminis TaxID=2571150 RepID=UPI001181F075|nr:2-oxo acid dehydrogenase subunit E2 [Croceicoccus sediminis]
MTASGRVIPLRGAQGMIADRMVKSLHEAAQLTHHATADASSLVKAKAAADAAGTRLSIEDLLMARTVRTLLAHPAINGRVEEREIRLSDQINLGIAISLPGGLLVAPAIFDAQDMSLAELRAARRDMAERARQNKLSVTEMTGGTFTISNLGLTRVEHFTPIVASPQIAILGIGRMTEQPVRGETGAVEWRPMVGLSLTFDHRALNGEPAAAFLTALCETIETDTSWT